MGREQDSISIMDMIPCSGRAYLWCVYRAAKGISVLFSYLVATAYTADKSNKGHGSPA